MLYSIDPFQEITHIPHERDYQRWRARLSDAEYEVIEAELGRRIGAGEVHTSSWIPGSDWSNTPFDPIYSKACEYDDVASGLCFGLFLWVVMQKHSDAWAFGRYEKDGIPIRGLTYFRIQQP